MLKLDEITDWTQMIGTVTNADCLKAMKLIPDNSIDLVLTDPPYGMSFVSGFRKEKHDEIKNDDATDWVEDFYREISRISKKETHQYIFCSHHNIDIFLSLAKKYLDYKNILVWEKNNTGMGDLFSDYAPKHELIIFCGDRKLNGGRDPNILKFSRTQNELHPTQKPVDMMKYLILKSTNSNNDIVLDCFIGSGTTIRACKDIGRNWIGIELEEKYCKIAEERLSQEVLFTF